MTNPCQVRLLQYHLRVGISANVRCKMMHELDRYNGRDTDIDIISFVRSNDFTNTKQSVGFLVDEIDDLKMLGSVFEIVSCTIHDLNFLSVHIFENLSKRWRIPRPRRSDLHWMCIDSDQSKIYFHVD